jgi:hypothetical protein
MPAISYNDFSGGLDRRLSVNSQDANKLWELTNAYVTTGKRLKKRPGLALVASGLTGSFGLKSVDGALNVFCDTGAVFTPPVVSGLTINRKNLDIPAAGNGSGSTLDRIYYADLFQGFIYLVARYANGQVRHHYLDGKTSTVTITNASPGVVTWTAHGLQNGEAIVLSTTGSLPTGLVAGTVYYVVSRAADTFQLSATVGGASINTSSAGAGVHTATVKTYIGDANCPHTMGITKAASRVFAPSAENVRYCAAGSARDWTTASDAGFLAAGLQQDTKGAVKACGTFQDSLTVLFEDSAQIWNVAVDPSANAISKRLYGTGTEEPLSLASFFSDLVFLSPFGFRSMTVQAVTSRIDDNDVGVPVDDPVQDDIAVVDAIADPYKALGVWIPELGQYWGVLDRGNGTSKVWAYTFSRSSKIACWSEYTFPVQIKGITTLSGKVYLRDTDKLYEVSPTQYTDNNTLIDVEIQMAFQDAKLPGVGKQFYGADMVCAGQPELSYLYDPNDTDKETVPLTVPADTRPEDLLPVEVVSPAIAPIFRHSADEALSIDALTLYYHSLANTV